MTSTLSSTYFALGLRRQQDGKTLDVLYPSIEHDPELLKALGEHFDLKSDINQWYGVEAALFEPLKTLWDKHGGNALLDELNDSGMGQCYYGDMDLGLIVLNDGSQTVKTPEEAYFKLHLLSHRVVKPHDVCMDSAFAVLNNVAWTQKGPILPADLPRERIRAQLAGEPLVVSHVDKFPYLVNYHIPTGVRIASGAQVRLGAHLGEGTTVMPAGYVNFNAGTKGHAMIEGRVSAGVFVGDHSDVGGGASIMGTLSGGNNHVISIGDNCLLGANAGAGISLGDGCTIAAGLYVYAGMKIALVDLEDQPINLSGEKVKPGENIVKASAVSGRNHLLFIQDSRTGQVICKPNAKTIELNAELHSNN